MNQHKDLLYRQKYATYQLNNRTFSTQNTKISARSLAISYICFQVHVRIVKKKKKKKSHTINYYGISGDSRTPDPRQGLYIREIATGEITVSITPDDHLEGPYLLKTRELPGAPPPGPLQGPYGGPLDPTRMRRAVRYAHGFFRPPLFGKSWIRHCTHPPLLVQVTCPPPPPWRGMPGTPLALHTNQLYLINKGFFGVGARTIVSKIEWLFAFDRWWRFRVTKKRHDRMTIFDCHSSYLETNGEFR